MTCAAQLCTHDLELTRTDRTEPHRNSQTGNGVLILSHVLERKTMDHIFRRNLKDHRAMIYQIKLIFRNQVVLRGGIIGIEAKRIAGVQKLPVSAAEFTVRTRVVEVPCKLLPDNTHSDSVFTL